MYNPQKIDGSVRIDHGLHEQHSSEVHNGSLDRCFQRNFLYHQGTRHAFDWAQSLAFSRSFWVLADDLAGLQELKLVVVLSPRGEVLASTKPEYIGRFFSDAIRQRLLGR
ncbi:MAG: hypothetical protein QX199_09715 [Methylococcaceae bacterium]